MPYQIVVSFSPSHRDTGDSMKLALPAICVNRCLASSVPASVGLPGS